MRILFLSHYFPPEGNAPATRTYENCKRWVQRGHEVTVITCVPNVPNGVIYEGYKNRLYQREIVDGVNVVRVWSYIAANAGALRRIINYISFGVSAVAASLLVRKPDILIATSPQFFCGWAGVAASFLRRVVFVLEIRDIWPDSIIAVGAMKPSMLVTFLYHLERCKDVAISCLGNRTTAGKHEAPFKHLYSKTYGVDYRFEIGQVTQAHQAAPCVFFPAAFAPGIFTRIIQGKLKTTFPIRRIVRPLANTVSL